MTWRISLRSAGGRLFDRSLSSHWIQAMYFIVNTTADRFALHPHFPSKYRFDFNWIKFNFDLTNLTFGPRVIISTVVFINNLDGGGTVLQISTTRSDLEPDTRVGTCLSHNWGNHDDDKTAKSSQTAFLKLRRQTTAYWSIQEEGAGSIKNQNGSRYSFVGKSLNGNWTSDFKVFFDRSFQIVGSSHRSSHGRHSRDERAPKVVKSTRSLGRPQDYRNYGQLHSTKKTENCPRWRINELAQLMTYQPPDGWTTYLIKSRRWATTLFQPLCRLCD